MSINIYDRPQEMSEAVAAWIVKVIRETLEKQERFTFCLSGGSTPKTLHHLLATAPYKDEIDWSRLHFFWGDERAVPFDDDRNNAKMAFETLLNLVPVVRSQIHVMRTDIPPENAAAEYALILHDYFPETKDEAQTNSFDLVLLGMGDDGHTLSLFPGTPVIHETKAWASAFFLAAQNMFRITLTLPIVNRSSRIAFLTIGNAKAHALKQVLEGEYRPELYPSQLIRPVNGELNWFVDRAAASSLS